MVNKSNIILILIGTFLSAQLPFFRFFGFFNPHHHWFGHSHWATGSFGFTTLVGIVLIFLGLYNIYKDNKIKSNSETK